MLLQPRSGAEELPHPPGQVAHLVAEQTLVEAFLGEDAEVGLLAGPDHEEVAAVDLDHGQPELAGRLFGLKEGEVTPAMRVATGWVFGTVTGRQDAYVPQLAEVRARVSEDLKLEKAAGLVKEEGRCPLPITQTVMADALGLTPVHVNRILRDLRAEKMIQHRQRTLTILDWGRLKVFAEFDAHYLHVEPQLM